MGGGRDRSRGKSPYRERIKSINMPNMGSREVTISKMLMCENMVRETRKNKNYLVAHSELHLAIYAYDSREFYFFKKTSVV